MAEAVDLRPFEPACPDAGAGNGRCFGPSVGTGEREWEFEARALLR